MGPALAIAIATVFGYLALAPAVVNGDGLGYLKAAVSGLPYPGHLLYLPMLRLLRLASGAGQRPIEGLWPARALSAVGAGVAVLALAAATRRLVKSERAPTIAAAGLAGSFGMIAAGSDVETYAPALAGLCVCLWAIACRRTGAGVGSLLVAALALAVATLFHVENVLFTLPVLLALGRRDGVIVAGAAGALVLASYLALSADASWVLGASHGFRYPVHWYTPAVAIYGACKALLFSPYPYEASWARVIGHFVPGALALGTLGWIALGRDPDRPTRAPLGRAATIGWAVPYALVGVAFFPSDSERGVVLLPLFWLTVAATRRRANLALAVAIGLGVLNVIVWLPRARDASWRDRAGEVARDLRAGDLVVSPGHGWDEYIGVYDGPAVGHFPLVFHVARLGSAAAVRPVLAEAIRDARRRGHGVFLVRFGADGDPMGWKELLPFGVTPGNAAELLPAGERVGVSGGAERLEAE